MKESMTNFAKLKRNCEILNMKFVELRFLNKK